MSQQIQVLSFDTVIDRLIAGKKPYHSNYRAMYSSWYGGIVTDPQLMLVPLDDHLVHRGDGIFEAFLCLGGNMYLLDRHLDRLERSASFAQLRLPVSRSELVNILKITVRASGFSDAMIRIFVSRGPGGFSTDPYEPPASQLYVMVAAAKFPPAERYLKGATLATSRIPVKKSYFANVKSCNYLPNVMMHKEALDSGVDFTVSVDEQGHLAEGSTANIALVTTERVLLTPRFERILQGTTVSRVLELAETLVAEGELAKLAQADITPQQAYQAAEILMCGTTLDTMPVVTYDGHAIGDGQPGPICRRLRDLLREDQQHGDGVLTGIND